MAQNFPPAASSGRAAAQANPVVVVSALTVIGLAALVLGVFRVLDAIREPFAVTEKVQEAADSARLAEERRLKSQDTDQDGLNDYDELTLYSTSPFLLDSDSDGADDKAETLASTDPNCPEGKDCGALSGATNGNVNAATGSGGSLAADSLRQTLKEAGAPAYLVDSADDATLLKLYEDVVGTTNANIDSPEVLRSLSGLSAPDIRKLLEGAGADAALLQQVDDASLKSLFDSALQDELTNTNS